MYSKSSIVVLCARPVWGYMDSLDEAYLWKSHEQGHTAQRLVSVYLHESLIKIFDLEA